MGAAPSVLKQEINEHYACRKPKFYVDKDPSPAHTILVRKSWDALTQDAFGVSHRGMFEAIPMSLVFASVAVSDAFYSVLERRNPGSFIFSKEFVSQRNQPLKNMFMLDMVMLVLGAESTAKFQSLVEKFGAFYDKAGIHVEECKSEFGEQDYTCLMPPTPPMHVAF
jgi:hypothetical protein